MKKLAFSVFAAALTFGADAAENVETAAASESCCGYDGFYFGLGIAGVNGGVKTESIDIEDDSGSLPKDCGVDSNDHSTKFAGSLTLGYGKRVNGKAYIGLEAGLDATQNSDFVHSDVSVTGKMYEIDSKVNGLVPSIALKLGYVHPETRGMIYLKAGAAYSKAKACYKETNYFTQGGSPDFWNYEAKVSKWSPIIALGGEKLCGKNIRTRLEVEYRFSSNKKVDFNSNSALSDNYRGTMKATNKNAITLRAMVIYTVRM